MVNKRITDFRLHSSLLQKNLGMMNRKYFDPKIVSSFMDTLRKKNTRIVCRTDMMGWPTETVEERNESQNLQLKT